jgi:hypothetical protein
MNVLTTTQPSGEQQSLGGASQYATVQAAGATVPTTKSSVAVATPGGTSTTTAACPAMLVQASGTYLVTGQAIVSSTLTGNIQIELLLNGVPQAIGQGGATALSINTAAGAPNMSIDWTALFATGLALGASATWSCRISALGGGNLTAGGTVTCIAQELGN